MELISYYLNQGLSFIIPLVILLGLLIFVHELGHFLVAKYYGVRVEVFSLGFGKKFFKYRKGDTEYCLSIIPFGGYVKMYGDDPTAEVPEDMKKFSFTHKPVGQRIAVVLAGPLMNFFFAILLFTAIAFVGEDVVRPVVGDISVSSRAYLSGLRSGDEIQSVNALPVRTWNEVREKIESNGAGQVRLAVKGTDGSLREITSETTLAPNPNPLSSEALVGDLEGLSFMFRSSRVAVGDPHSKAALSGFKTGDTIVRIEGVSVERWVDLESAVATQLASGKTSITFSVERADEKGKVTTQDIPLSLTSFQEAGFDYPDLYVSKVVEGSAAAAAGLEVNDKIIGVSGKIQEWPDLVKQVQSYKDGAEPLKVELVRNGEVKTFDLVPKKIKQSMPNGKDSEVYAIGVLAGVMTANPLTLLERTTNPWKALSKGFADSLLWTKNTCLSFLRLLQNRVSAKSIGGPIMIGQLASKTFQVGLSPFMKIMAIISINLFILNLLPVPVLDGGHLVFFTLEAFRGAPLSMRKMEVAQQIGLVLLMSLMVLALFNDVSRLFN